MAKDGLILDHRYMQAGINTVDGQEYPWIRTAPAATILPWRKAKDGTIEVLLLRQHRPELDNENVIKTVGGYLLDHEDADDCIRRNASHKLGVKLPLEFIFQRVALGFPRVAEFPIALYTCEGWVEVVDPAPGCLRLPMPLSAAFDLVVGGHMYDTCTEQSVVQLFGSLRE